MSDEIVREEDSNTSEEVVIPEETNEETDQETVQDESVDDVRSKLQKAEELANNYKIRAEKAERKAKEKSEVSEPVQKSEPKQNLNTLDTIALVNEKVHVDDIPEVLDYAKFKKISVAEALKSPIILASLKQKSEFRTTAAATNTGKNRPSNQKESVESLLQKATKTGELPESDDDLRRMADARYTRK